MVKAKLPVLPEERGVPHGVVVCFGEHSPAILESAFKSCTPLQPWLENRRNHSILRLLHLEISTAPTRVSCMSITQEHTSLVEPLCVGMGRDAAGLVLLKNYCTNGEVQRAARKVIRASDVLWEGTYSSKHDSMRPFRRKMLAGSMCDFPILLGKQSAARPEK